MRKFPILKCPICGKAYKEVGTFGNHMRNEHPGTIPEGWSDLRYAYFVHTGKSRGHCRECGGDTQWNETTGAYTKICTSEACRKKFRERFMAGMRARYGKANLLDDPSFRERMLTNRRISGELEFFDGGKVGYMGTLEKKFLAMLNTFFRFPSSDIISPSPNRYIYYYENPNDEEHRGMHSYVPDFYIPSCNLEIELKASNNQRPKNLLVDVVKDACKDIMMIRNPNVNYCKVYEEDYYVFFQVFADVARQNETGEKKPIKYISRALLTSLYREYIPDDCLKILDQYIYQYSEKSVTKKPKNPSQMPTLESTVDASDPVHDQNPVPLAEAVYSGSDDDPTEEILENDDAPEPESVGVNPLMYYELGQYAPVLDDVSKPSSDSAIEAFNIESDFFKDMASALEADLNIDTGSIDGRASIKYGRWRDKLFGNKILGKFVAKAFSKVTVNDGRLYIKGINCNLLLYRIKEHYSEAKLKYIFEYRYNEKSWKLYQKKKIGKGDMKIDYVYAPEFFCLELVEMFKELGNAYNDSSYIRIAELIYEASWLSKADTQQVPPLSLDNLSNLRLELLPHQKKFIELWPILKNQLNLNGYILAFPPGKGKTLTAVGLAECLNAKKVYIVCPNNLKDNWALEIKKYYAKYDDDAQWMRDVCILGTKYGNPDTARFIITNNENIKLMMPVAKSDPDSMLILDESHNFRNYSGGRSKELFDLADKINSHNVLCVSATPIKAVPSELTPALRLVDPTFNDEAAEMYAHCFNLSDVMAMSIVNKRFGKVIYCPVDATVELPPKLDTPMKLHIKNEKQYYLEEVTNEVKLLFNKLQTEWLSTVREPRKYFEESIKQYAMAPRKDVMEYLDWVIQASDSLNAGNGTDYHELRVKEFLTFIDDCVRPNSNCPMGEADKLLQMQDKFVTAAKSNMGKAVGSIYPKRRAQMFIDIWDENRDIFIDKIRGRTKKTIIFSTMVPIIKHIASDLNSFGVGTVSITGETKDRLEILTKFREDPNTLVLVATSWCMGVGVTLTEASQMFFFGAPWRSTDYEQASDRIWRIGQTDTVNIINVGLASAKPNLSDRMDKILDWSARMFGSAITATEIDDAPEEATQTPAQEYYGMGMLYEIVCDLNAKLNQYDYGMNINGKIVDPEDKTEYDRNYRTLSPGMFNKLKGGLCFDYAAFQDFFLKSHGCHGEVYFIEILEPYYTTHMFSVVPFGSEYVYLESAFLKIQGVYTAPNIDTICSFIINNMIEGMGIDKPKFNVYHVKVNYGWYNDTMNEYLMKIHKEGTKIKIKYNRNIDELPKLSSIEPVSESFGPWNPNLDSRQYHRLSISEANLLNDIIRAVAPVTKNYSDVPHTMLAKPFSGPLCRFNDNEDTPHMAFTPFETEVWLERVLRRIDQRAFHFMVVAKCPAWGCKTFIHPIVCVPFYDGAIWFEYGFSYRRNDTYFVDDIKTAAQEVISWCMRCYDISAHDQQKYDIQISIYPIENEFVLRTMPNMTYETLMEYLQGNPGMNHEALKSIQIPFDPWHKEPFKMEVLGYGWTVTRF